jgi:hypothetical protein
MLLNIWNGIPGWKFSSSKTQGINLREVKEKRVKPKQEEPQVRPRCGRTPTVNITHYYKITQSLTTDY